MPVICNSGPLIALGKLNHLELLTALYANFIIPAPVYQEVVVEGLVIGMPDALTIKLFVENRQVKVESIPPAVIAAYSPPVILGPGEVSVLALAKTVPDPLVLMDDEIARSEAHRLGFSVKGTLGILIEAHRKKYLTIDQVELLLREIAARPDIWISEQLCFSALASLGE
jgi:predicted nucleic acid-binding protein